jgi:SAM-dependent methyltransferase
MSESDAVFVPVPACWICGGAQLTPVHELRFELDIYATQDPALAAYSGQRLALRRCEGCGFAQPESLPALPRFFDRLYDQRWSPEWIAGEFQSPAKDAIFAEILRGLAARLAPGRRRLLDVGAHAGRFLDAARRAGWAAEGLELNPQTAAYATRASGVVVHQGNVQTLDPGAGRFDAVTLTDVLEHVPNPLVVLRRVHALLAAGGVVGIKVPNGPVQRAKEQVRARVTPGYRATLADNLVHVNHFSPAALRLALHVAGFGEIPITAGAPELPAGGSLRNAAARAVRRACYAATAITGGPVSPFAFNLQAYARR